MPNNTLSKNNQQAHEELWQKVADLEARVNRLDKFVNGNLTTEQIITLIGKKAPLTHIHNGTDGTSKIYYGNIKSLKGYFNEIDSIM